MNHKYILKFSNKQRMSIECWRAWINPGSGYGYWSKSYNWQFQYNKLDRLYLKFHKLL